MPNTRRPNVVFFFTDQQRWDSTGVHGNPMGITPNFDRMAMEGTHCANACTPQPVCLPARLVLQTGKYASQFGCYNNGGSLPVGTRTLGHAFRDAGYRTGYIGKWHLCHTEPVPPENRDGYEYWLGSNVLEFTSDAYRTVMYDGDGRPVRLPGYRIDALTDAAIRFIDERREEPFFLFLSFLEPHFQNTRDDYPAPAGYEQKYLANWMPPDLQALGGTAARHLPGYYGMIKRLDEALGRLQDALRSLDILDNTIVVYTTDHGCHFKTRNSEYKRSCHDASVRVPLALSGPGFESGGRLKDMISLIDLPPTLLDACGIEVPNDMQGRSILPLTRGERNGWPGEAYMEICDTHLARAVRTPRWKYCIRKAEPGRDAGGNWEFTEHELYDLMADPYEQENVMGGEAYRQAANVLRERLVRRMVEAGEPVPVILPTEWKPSGQRRISDAEARL